MSAAHFADRLAHAIRQTGNPVCVGLDPRWESLPAPIRERAQAGPGSPAEQRARGYEEFCLRIIDAIAGMVPIIKPQVAFFEECGPAGMAVLWRVMRAARQAGLLVIADAKRGDIGTTAEAYAQAYLGDSGTGPGQGGVDALTINPYMGRDTLVPFLETARAGGCGVYILVRTSNPGAGTFQDLTDTTGRKLFQQVAALVEELALADLGSCGLGSAGAVVGATYPRELAELRQAMPHVPLLIPGYGTQGAGAADVAPAFGPQGIGAVVNSSRGIIFAHARKDLVGRFAPDQWEDAVRLATRQMIDDLAPHCRPTPSYA